MKTMRTMVAGLLLGTALFTSCSKENYNADPMNPASPSNTAQARTGMTTTAKVSSGIILASNLRINNEMGVLHEVREMRTYRLDMPINELRADRVLGTHKKLETMIRAEATSAHPSIIFTGSISRPTSAALPLRIEVTRPVTLNQVVNEINVIDASTLNDLLRIDMSRLLYGIDQPMWDAAVRNTDGSITISERTNVQLYDMVMRNMSGNINVQW